MLITRKSIFAVLIALFVLAGFGIASAAQIGGLANTNTSGTLLPPTLHNYVNPAGLGQTLLYNYYNARGSHVTFFTVTNTDSSHGIRARVRLREAADIADVACNGTEPRGSFEILDFDLCLSANDQWTGAIQLDPATGAAVVCAAGFENQTLMQDGVNPGRVFPSSCVLTKFGANGLANGKITADDTLEGYIEIIGERSIAAEPLTCGNPGVTSGLNADHDVNNGAPTNSLFGNAAIVDQTPTGQSFIYDATAIADFTASDIASGVQTSVPDLTNGQDGLIGVNFILTKSVLYTVYDLNDAQTAVVVTLPTKALTQGTSCDLSIFRDDRVTFQFFDDAEHPTTGSGCAFSPCLPSAEDHLPFEVNMILPTTGIEIVPHGDRTAAGSIEVEPLIPTPYIFGWLSIDLNRAGVVPAHATGYPVVPVATSFGWPALGLSLVDFESGVSTGAFPMTYQTDVR